VLRSWSAFEDADYGAVLDAAPELCRWGVLHWGGQDRPGGRERARHCGVQRSALEQPSVAELALGEIILLLRRTFESSTQLHGGVWNKSAAGSHEVRGQTLGLWDTARLDRRYRIWPRRWACGCVPRCGACAGAGQCPAGELPGVAGNSDVITLHVDGKTQNQDLFSEDEFRAMKDGAC